MSFRNPLIAPVTIAGPVTVQTTGTPGTVTQTGAATTLSPPAGIPTAAARSVSASSSAIAALSTGSATLVAAPGVGKRLELHALIVNIFNGSGVALGVEVDRSDAVLLWYSGKLPAGTAASWPYDFLGATLPDNIGLVLNAGAVPAGCEFSATLAYNVLS